MKMFKKTYKDGRDVVINTDYIVSIKQIDKELYSIILAHDQTVALTKEEYDSFCAFMGI